MTGSNDHRIYIFDYEVCKLLGCIALKPGVEPSVISFINGYKILIIGSNDGYVYFIHFEITEMKISHKIIAEININATDINNSGLRSS